MRKHTEILGTNAFINFTGIFMLAIFTLILFSNSTLIITIASGFLVLYMLYILIMLVCILVERWSK